MNQRDELPMMSAGARGGLVEGTLRTARDRVFGPAALAVGVIGWLVYSALLLFGVGGTGADVVLIAVVTGGAAIACELGGRGRARVTSRLFGLAILAYGTSTVFYTVVPDAAAHFPSVYDLGLFLFYPLVLTGVVVFARSQIGSLSGGLRIDCVAGAIAVMALGTVVLDLKLDSLISVGIFAYVLGDLCVLGFLATAWALSGCRFERSSLVLALAASVLVVGDGTYATTVTHGTLTPGTLSSILWPAALLILAATAFQPRAAASRPSPSWFRVIVPVASAGVCVPIGFLASHGSVAYLIADCGVVVVLVRVILSLVENERLLGAAERSAVTDPLTGLANRALLLDRLGHALARQTRRGGSLALLFIDLDEFKTVNDSLGHVAGDRLLVTISERLSAALRRDDTIARPSVPAGSADRGYDTVARLGGDEFVVLLEELETPQDAAVVADRILEVLRAPLPSDEHELVVDASIGIMLSDGHQGRGPIDLLRDADTAMYAAKRAGKGGYQFFEADMHLQVVARTAVARELRSAISERELRLLYQPQLDLSTGQMTGVEALVRWQHPTRGLLTPDAFIPVAESTGMIVAIDDWVLREACTQMRAWDLAGVPPIGVAVNVSAGRLTVGDFYGTVADVLRETGADPARLEIELTETVAIEHYTAAVGSINRIRELGIRVAIDDFGMGHSALSRLQTFPIDRLKIDRSFVSPLTHNGAEQNSIPAAMIAMAHSLGLRVVAEGIETEVHLAALKSLGCECGQGYLFSRPVSPEQIPPLAEHRVVVPEDTQEPAQDASDTADPAASESFIRTLLAELQRLTGLDTTYLTHIDMANSTQQITHSRNTGMLDIPEGMTADWADTICRRALEEGVSYTDDVPSTFPDSQAGAELGLKTYITVPLHDPQGGIQGTLCGASCNPIPLGPETLHVMKTFAALISETSTSTPHDPTTSLAIS